MMDDYVKPGDSRGAALEKLLQQEAKFLKAKFEELNAQNGQKDL